MYRHFMLAYAAITLSMAGSALAQVIVSEIMYNPDSREADVNKKTPNLVEWVELYNTGDKAVDVTDWYLRDEDGRTVMVGEKVTLGAGQALVMIPAEQSVEAFHKAWGDGIAVVRMSSWDDTGLNYLSNSPSEKNEVLALVDADGNEVDVVNYDDTGDWPKDSPDGPSIYLLPGHLTADANDSGKSWARSIVDKHGAKKNNVTDTFNGEDIGSPGFVETKVDDDAAP